MGPNFWWVFDAVTVLVLIVCVNRCRRKGFSRIILKAIGCVVSLVVAWIVSVNTSDMIYDKFFKQKNIDAVQAAMEEYHPEDTLKSIIESNELSGVLSNDKIKEILKGKSSLDVLYEYANSQASNILDSKEHFKESLINDFAKAFADKIGVNLPPYVANEVTEHVGKSENLFLDTVNMILDSPDKVPAFVEENYIRSMAKKIISSAVFIVVFLVLMTIIMLLSGKSPQFGILNGFDRMDKAAGALLGLVEGVAIVMLLSMAAKIMVNMEDSETSFISMNTINNTVLFKHFYSFL